MSYHNHTKRPQKKDNTSMALRNIAAKTSVVNYAKLNALSKQMRIPMSSLVARAIDNELACERPFYRETRILKEYERGENTKESISLYQFIVKHPGLSKELLLIAREDIGIKDEQDVLIAIEHLLDNGQIEKVKPARPKYDNFPPDYVVYRANTRPTSIEISPAERRYEKQRTNREKAAICVTDDSEVDDE